MQFKPSPEVIQHTKMLLIARAYYNVLNADHLTFATQLLTTGTYYYHEQFYIDPANPKHGLPADRILRNAEHLFQINNTPYTMVTVLQPESLIRFEPLLHKQLTDAGYLMGIRALECAASIVENAEDRFLESSTADLPQPFKYFFNQKERQTRIDTLLAYYSSLDLWPGFHNEELLFLNAVKSVSISQEENYVNDEASFQKFLAYKRFIPIHDYLDAQNIPQQAAHFINVVGIWAYTPYCNIFQLEEAHFLGKKYLLDSLGGELIPHDDLSFLEKHSFQDFLLYVNR